MGEDLINCESCGKAFNSRKMVEAEQWFCKTCYNELCEYEEFTKRESDIANEMIEREAEKVFPLSLKRKAAFIQGAKYGFIFNPHRIKN